MKRVYSIPAASSILAILAISLLLFSCAKKPNHMPLGDPAIPPLGYIEFCSKHISECEAHDNTDVEVELTTPLMDQLNQVNRSVNASLVPKDEGVEWNYSTDGTGDCNTYVLTKRRALIQLGWAPSLLLMTTDITETGEAHLVLVIPTTAGDLVLDNRTDEIRDWRQVQYTWVSQQDSGKPTLWRKIKS